MRARYARRNPLVLQWVVVPVSLVPTIRQKDLRPGGLTAVYEAAGIARHSYTSTFLPTIADGAEARYLQVESGTPLIEERRVSHCLNDGRLVVYELLVTLYSNRIRLEFDWGGSKLNPPKSAKSAGARKRSLPAKRVSPKTKK
jgi:DNA-binding GntR family transcriptional regulator